MRKYETLLLLTPEIASDARTALIESLKSIIEREGGKLSAEDHWGMRDLAYPVKKQMRGYYVRLEYVCEAHSLVAEFERNIRITEGVFKFMSVKLADSVEEAA